MHYINPYHLLSINVEDLSKIDNRALIKEKKKLLHEIELGDKETITHSGIELTKSDCVRAIDDLDNTNKKEFHFFIYRNRLLNDFLTDGKLGLFENFRTESIYKLPEFLDFISPYFSFQYNRILANSFKEKKHEDITKLLSVKPITNDHYFESCYKTTYAFIRGLDDEINSLYNEIRKEYNFQVDFNRRNNLQTNLLPQQLARMCSQVEISVKRVSIRLKSQLEINSLNLLPSYFQSVRNQLASSIKALAIELNNDPYNLYESAFKLIQTANDIATDGLVRQSIAKNYYTIKGNYTNSLDKQTTPTVQQPTFKQESITKPEVVKENTISDETPKEQGNSKSSKNIYAGFLLFIVAIFLWSLFNRTVQTVVLSICALMYSVWFYNYLKKQTEYNRQKEIQTGIYIISGVVCICGFFTQILAILFLSYMLVSFLHLGYNTATSRKSEKPIMGLGYLAIAICITAFWYNSNHPSKSVAVSSPTQEEKLSVPSYDSATVSSTPLINSVSSSNSPINSTTNNLVPEPAHERVSIENGNLPQCSFTPKYNKQLNNKLIISTISSDAAVKIYNYETDKCIRYVFINQGSTYTVRNIPEGRYYLKIAYGNGWSVMQGDPICKGKFLSDVLYKRGSEILDFNLQYSNDGYRVPSYSLTLTTTFTLDKYHERSENEISDSDFYND